MRALLRVTGIVVMLVASAAAHAQIPDPNTALPERPSVSTHAHTVGPAILEVEAGYERVRHDGRFGDAALPVTLKLGLRRRLQLAVSTAVTRPEFGSTAIDDVTVGIKWRMADQIPLAGAVAVLPTLTLPSGAAASSGETAAGVLLISSQPIGALSLDLNVGHTWRTGDGSDAPTRETLWAASIGGALNGRVGWLAELHGFPATSGLSGHPGIVNALVGVTATVTSAVVLDVATLVPISGHDHAAVLAGIVWNAGRVWRR